MTQATRDAPRAELPKEREKQKGKRRMALGIVAVGIVALAIAFTAHHFLIGPRYESTDNACVQGIARNRSCVACALASR